MPLLLLLAACGGPSDALDCDLASQPVTGTIAPATDADVADDLAVSGTATAPGGLAIRSVAVLGIPAEPTAFNYATWSVSLSLAQLRAFDANADGDVTLTAVATDACGASWTIATPAAVHVTLADADSADSGDSGDSADSADSADSGDSGDSGGTDTGTGGDTGGTDTGTGGDTGA